MKDYTTWTDPLTNYLVPNHTLVGDRRTRQIFAKTIRGIMVAESLMCSHRAVFTFVG
jgi:hypothetical protein